MDDCLGSKVEMPKGTSVQYEGDRRILGMSHWNIEPVSLEY